MRRGLIVQARTGSGRLPGKVLMPILGEPMLARLIERARRSTLSDTLVVATSSLPGDDRIEALCDTLGVGCFRGSPDDVLERVLAAARAFDIDVIAHLTGDNPLVDASLIDAAIDRFLQGDVDYVSNVLDDTYPVGINVQVYSTSALARTASSGDPAVHEHVTLYLREHPEEFRQAVIRSPYDPSAASLRLTVDEEPDLALARAIFERLYPTNTSFSTGDVIELLQREPQLCDLNRHITQRSPR